MIVFISDVHSNLEALEAVYEDIVAEFGPAEIVCLGDCVGYGASPDEVVGFLREKELDPKSCTRGVCRF